LTVRKEQFAQGTVRAWIIEIAYGRAISWRRWLTARNFYKRVDLDTNVVDVVDPQTQVVQYEESLEGTVGKATLKKMFDVLSDDDQRETLRLYFFEGCTFEEIAARLGQKNVRNHFYRD